MNTNCLYVLEYGIGDQTQCHMVFIQLKFHHSQFGAQPLRIVQHCLFPILSHLTPTGNPVVPPPPSGGAPLPLFPPLPGRRASSTSPVGYAAPPLPPLVGQRAATHSPSFAPSAGSRRVSSASPTVYVVPPFLCWWVGKPQQAHPLRRVQARPPSIPLATYAWPWRR